MHNIKVGYALCGSFCTFSQVFPIMERLAQEHSVIPIFSQNVCSIDSRFGTAKEHIEKATRICGREPICTSSQAEPIGPKKLLDVLVICPCTGNTLGKLASGITDGPVTMAAKAHLRNGRPLVLAIATNDGLSAAAGNLGALMNRKHYYFVPFGQDDPIKKPTSMVADFTKLPRALEMALNTKQLQPILL